MALSAQTTIPSSVKPDPYAAEPLVIERSDREVTVAADGTGTDRQIAVVRVPHRRRPMNSALAL